MRRGLAGVACVGRKFDVNKAYWMRGEEHEFVGEDCAPDDSGEDPYSCLSNDCSPQDQVVLKTLPILL